MLYMCGRCYWARKTCLVKGGFGGGAPRWADNLAVGDRSETSLAGRFAEFLHTGLVCARCIRLGTSTPIGTRKLRRSKKVKQPGVILVSVEERYVGSF